MSENDNILIEMRHVSFAYGSERETLRDVCFQLRAGHRVGVIGDNGSGKTTLLHLMVGLLKPVSGELIAFGRPRRVEADFLETRRRAGLVFQDSNDQLFSPTVIDDVAFGPLNLGRSPDEAVRIARRTLQSLHLEGFERRVTYDLSGGEKRMIALATVLALEPEALLLDEPQAGLDAHAMERVVDALNDLPHAKLIVSHNMDFLEKTTDSLLRLEDGVLRRV